MTSQHGSDAEDSVERILSSCYLADFVVRSPTYEKAAAGKKEAADLLLPFGDELVCFQVKSRQIPEHKEAIDEKEIGRINRRVDHAIQQVKTIREALGSGQIEEVENLRGIALPLRLEEPRTITGIVVLNVQHPESWSEEDRVAIYGGLDKVHGISVHVFLLDDFELIAREVDTLPDLFQYLSVREKLMRRRVVFPMTAERDFLAVYLTQYGLIEDCLSGKLNSLMVMEGTWDGVLVQRAEEFAKRADDKRASRIFDKLIEEAHKCIGFNPASEAPPPNGSSSTPTTKAASSEDYVQVVHELSRVHRADRIVIGEKIIEKAKRADTDPKGFSYFVSMPPHGDTLFVFLASRLDRTSRRDHLWKVSAVAHVRFRPKMLIGVAAPNFGATSGSQDYLVLGEGVAFDDEEDLLRVGSQLFQDPVRHSRDEWGNDYLSDGDEEGESNGDSPG